MATTLADIDGTNGPGVALLLMAKPLADDDPAMMWERLVESATMPDPSSAAWGLRDSVASDWPEHQFTLVQNARAKFLVWRGRMQRYLGGYEDDDYAFEHYLLTIGEE